MILLALLSLIFPAVLVVGGFALEAWLPGAPASARALLNLALYIYSAITIIHVFVDKKRRALSLGETWLVATLCLAWALVLNYELLREILFVAETAGPFGPASAFGMVVGLHLLMLHVAFGVVGTRYARWRCGRLADSQRNPPWREEHSGARC